MLVPAEVQAATTYGPRVDELLIKIYGTDTALFTAFEAQEIDLVDWPITSTDVQKWQMPPYSTYIALDSFKEIGMFEFDVNNNLTMRSYPNWPSPTSYVEFRRAIAYLIDKPYIITTIVGGYGAQLETPIMPWTTWYDTSITPYTYNPVQACQILFDNGWRSSPDPNVVAYVRFPPGHPMAGQFLKDVMVNGPHGASDPGLIFYRPIGYPTRSEAGALFIYGDATHLGLEDVGIPVDDNNWQIRVISPHVLYEKNFHIYTGAWNLDRDPDYLYDLWHSDFINWNIDEFAWNYNNIDDASWDEYTWKLKTAKDFDEAELNAELAQQRFVDQAFFFPLWTSLGYMAHNMDWHELNVDSYGVRHQWNIHCTYQASDQQGKQGNPSVGGTLEWGFSSDIEQLNVIYSSWFWDWQILDKVYDTMTRFNPLNIAADMPWMASGWTVGTWTNPDTGEIASKITMTLRTGMKWTNSINGAILGSVTPADVRFSFQYVYDKVGWNFASVADQYKYPNGTLKIEVSGNQITFYESIQSVWAFHWIGGLPIIPKFIFEGIADPQGFTPGNLGIEETLIGCGAFYYMSYNPGVSFLLRANRNHFKPIVPNTDTDPTNIKIDWGIFKGNPRSGDWDVDVLDLIIVATSLGIIIPPIPFPPDVNKDGVVNVLDLIIIATCLGAEWDP
jgi:peptide/nickel transport system substrate-binding protein